MFNKMILNYNPKNLLKEGGTIFMKKKKRNIIEHKPAL